MSELQTSTRKGIVLGERRQGNEYSEHDLDQIDSAIQNSILALKMAAPQYRHLMFRAETLFVEDNPELFAATDGVHILFGPKFLELSQALQLPNGRMRLGEQEFVIAHEVMHMARTHVDRMMRMRSRAMGYNPQIGNIVADAFVNEDIIDWKPVKFMPPTKMISWETVTNEARLLAKQADMDLPEMFTEEIYEQTFEGVHDEMLKLARAANENDPKGLQEAIQRVLGISISEQGDGSSDGEGEKGNGSSKDNQDQKQKSMPGTHGHDKKEQPKKSPSLNDHIRTSVALPDDERIIIIGGNDLQPPPQGKGTSEDEAERDTIWRAALTQASQTPGTEPGKGILGLTQAEPIKAPWHKLLADLLTRFLAPVPTRSFNKPAHNTIVAYAAGKPYWPAFIEPGLAHHGPGGTLAFCIDTSGSMPDEILVRAAGHLMEICQKFKSPVHVITADHCVQQVWEDANDLPQTIQEIIEEGFAGRGGTSFNEALDKAHELCADAVVYITDGYANFPEEPPHKLPVVWAVTPDGISEEQFPWGMVVELD